MMVPRRLLMAITLLLALAALLGYRAHFAAPKSAEFAAASVSGVDAVTIDRAELERAIRDVPAAAPMGRALLHRGGDGEFDGYRLSLLRPGSLPDLAGLRDGDILHAVNGVRLRSLDEAQAAVAELRSAPSFTLELTRRGRAKVLRVDMR